MGEVAVLKRDDYPIPAAALDDRLGWVGTSGSGKTYNAGSGVERLLQSGARVVIVDPLDVWWGLRLTATGEPSPYTLPIFGGAHGDLPLNEHAGKLIGETVAGMAESCIVSLGGLATKEAERRFMLSFLETLYRKTSGDPVHVIFDEADLWAPQQAGKGAGPQLQALMEQVVRRGRVKGFIPWLITQRPAVISKDVLSQVDGLVSFKLTSSHDRDAIGDWVKGQADLDQWKAIWASLPTMQRGEGVVWVPARGILSTAAFPGKQTFDSSRTPKRGERKVTRDLKPLNLERLKQKLAAVEQHMKVDDPKALKAEVARLTRELAAAHKQVAAPPAPERVIANADEIEAARKAGEQAGIAIGIARAQQALAALRVDDPPGQPVTAPVPRPARAPKVTASPVAANGSVPQGCAKPLAALTGVFPAGMTEAQWAIAAGYKRSGGTWSTYKSRLKAAAMIEQREGKFFATEAGAVGDVELPPAPGPDLVRWWAAKLPGTARMAEALIGAWPELLSKEELAARIEMSAAGGSFGTYVSRLASPGLIERGPAGIRLSDAVMTGAG
jgi:hypothetical protein